MMYQAYDWPTLISGIDTHLITLLRQLGPAQWASRTLSPKWTIKDIALHLLDGNVRALSMGRDGFFGVKSPEIRSYGDLTAFLNQLNHDWVHALQRMSPEVLIAFLETTNEQVVAYYRTLDPGGQALFSVAWAGESVSTHSFHLAREYTEKWHHQMQIRQALGIEADLLEARWQLPYLHTSFYALPNRLQQIPAPEGTTLRVRITGSVQVEIGVEKTAHGHWLLREDGLQGHVSAQVTVPDTLVWRVFSKEIAPGEAMSLSQTEGDPAVCSAFFDTVAVMA